MVVVVGSKLATGTLRRPLITARLLGRGVSYQVPAADMGVADSEADILADQLEEDEEDEGEEGEEEDQDNEGMLDAEGEFDSGEDADADGDDADTDADVDGAEGEDDDDDDDGEVVGAVKTRSTRSRARQKPEDNEDSYDDGDEHDVGSDRDSSEEDDEEPWQAGEDAEDDDDNDNATVDDGQANCCIFCGQDEENDPGEIFEEFLACAVCGDHAHPQCAREDGKSPLLSEEDSAQWRCDGCVESGLEADFKQVPRLLSSGRRTSAPRMARDLLPAARNLNPGSHSIYNTLILPDDEMDGSRSLRKRKTPSAEDDDLPRPAIRKRRKTDEDEINDPNGDRAENTVEGGVEDADTPKSRSGRPQRHLKNRKKGPRIVSQSDDPKSIILSIPVTVAQWDQIERDVLKKQKRRERDRLRRARNSRRTVTAEPEESGRFPTVQTTMYSNPFFPFPDRETEDNKGKPYGGILTEAEADTSKTYPSDVDREAFQKAREKAEREWKEKVAKMNGEPVTTPRTKQAGPPSKIKCINFGQYEIDTWHAAPYPEEYSRNKHLYICEFCLKYMSSDYVAFRHKLKCSAKHPPGDEIYRKEYVNSETKARMTLSFFEVDGRRNPLYCQNLCLLAKLFLGSKTLYYDVEPFLFYVMTENDQYGCHFVGYFSKEKRGCGLPPPLDSNGSFEQSQDFQLGNEDDASLENTAADPALSNPGNNVSCILVLPVYMRHGFGKVLIEFSYLLTKVEGKTGSPEKPLSDMGLVSYRSYWRGVICRLLLRYEGKENGAGGPESLSIVKISKETGMTPDDVISSLEALRALVRDPITKRYALRLDYEYMKEYVEKQNKKASIKINPESLCWTPYIMGRPTNLFAMGEEANQPLQTVAPRDEPAQLLPDPGEGVQQAHKIIQDASQEDEDKVLEEAVEIAELPTANGTTEVDESSQLLPVLAPMPTLAESKNESVSRPHSKGTPNGLYYSNSGEASPGSIFSGSQHNMAGPIPPTRYEIMPQIPGMQTLKRRPGRPVGRSSRRNRTYDTPARRRSGPNSRNYTPSTAMRRARSKLGNNAVQASTDDVGQDGHEDDVWDGHADAVVHVEEHDDGNGAEEEQIDNDAPADEDAPADDDTPGDGEDAPADEDDGDDSADEDAPADEDEIMYN